MKEEWRDIKDYENIYQISNIGRFRSLDRYETHMVNGKEVRRLIKGIIREGTLNKDGYLQVGLSRNGKQETKCIHQLVAGAFIPNPNNLPEVNHKSEIKTQNNVENLEWCDQGYNNAYGTRAKRAAETNTNHPSYSKPIHQINKNTNEVIAEFPSTMEVERQLGFGHSDISKCCRGRRNSAYGYKWSFK